MRFLGSPFTEISEEEADQLSRPLENMYAVEVKPPRNREVPETLNSFVRGILEIQTSLLGLKNTSPLVVYEFQRPSPDQLLIQFLVPTKRLERKLRTHLSIEIPGIGFDKGYTGLPLAAEDLVGGGMLTTGRKDRFPLRSEFNSPPINGLVALLHRHAMMDTRFVVQILFQPVAGQPFREEVRKQQGYNTVGYLRKEKDQALSSRSATPRERQQANAVEQKLGQRRYWVSIRFAVIGAGKYTPSRVKELAGGFNIFENPETGQYLDIYTLNSVRRKPFIEFYRAVRSREFRGYSLRFQVTVDELSGLLSVPDIDQRNVQYAQP